MAVNTTTINGYVHQADGSVREKSYVIFEQTGFDTDDASSAVVVSTPIRTPIGATGLISQALWPNGDGVRVTRYRVTFELYNGTSARLVNGGVIEVPATGGPYALNDLLPVDPDTEVSPTIQELLDLKADKSDIDDLEDQISQIAVSNGKGPYATVADGLADTVNGDVFTAYDGDRFVGYQNVSGAAVELSSFASLADVDGARPLGLYEVEEYGSTADALDDAAAAVSALGGKIVKVNTDYTAHPDEFDNKGNVIFVGAGSTFQPNTDSTSYRRTVIPEGTKFATGFADIDLSSLTNLAHKDDIKVVVTGDSLTTFKANQINMSDGLAERLETAFRQSNPDRDFTFVGRGIGGQKWDNLNDKPSPEVAAIYPWYLDTNEEWLTYIEDQNADIVVISLGMNDRQIFSRGSFEAVLGKIGNWANAPQVVLCTPMVPTLSPHPNFSEFGEYADQEGRDWNAGYVRTWAQYYGIPFLDINRTFNMVRDGRDILDCTYIGGLPEAIVPDGNWQAADDQACRSWSAVVGVKASAWTDPDVLSISASTAAGNVIFLEDNGSGEIQLRLFRGPALQYETVQTGIPTPTVDTEMEFGIRNNEFRIRVYEDTHASDPFATNLIRYGGLYQPSIGFSTGALGAIYSVEFRRGVERPYMPLGTDIDIWGVQNADASIDPVTGGGGPNHPSSYGASLIYGTHFGAQNFALPKAQIAEPNFEAILYNTSGSKDLDVSAYPNGVLIRKFLVTASSVEIATITQGAEVGQEIVFSNALGSTQPLTVKTGAIQNPDVTIQIGGSLRAYWDGTSWVTEDNTQEADILAAVNDAVGAIEFLSQSEVDFTPAITFATPGTLSVAYGARTGHYVRTGNVVEWEAYIPVTSLSKGTASGEFRLDLSGIGLTPSGRLGSGSFVEKPGQVNFPTIAGETPINIQLQIEPSETFATVRYTSKLYASQTLDAADIDNIGSTAVFWFTGKFRV